MKLILTQEVTGLGAPGDVVEVKDGYGRNFLIPRGFGIRWTKGGEKTIESIKAARTSREVRDLDHAKEIKAKLEGSSFDLPVRAGEGGRLFGAVTVTDIASAISEAGATVDKRKIIVGNPIKSLGSHQVTVKVHDDVDATVNLNVVPALPVSGGDDRPHIGADPARSASGRQAPETDPVNGWRCRVPRSGRSCSG
jgi:large subunit ribosomal protein L9